MTHICWMKDRELCPERTPKVPDKAVKFQTCPGPPCGGGPPLGPGGLYLMPQPVKSSPDKTSVRPSKPFIRSISFSFPSPGGLAVSKSLTSVSRRIPDIVGRVATEYPHMVVENHRG